jgi:apolipoprotein N-acyltransferase
LNDSSYGTSQGDFGGFDTVPPGDRASIARVNRILDFWLRAQVVLAAASVLSLIAPPTHLHPLHWFAYVPMMWVLDPESTRKNALLGWAYGTMAVGCIFFWIFQTIVLFSNIPSYGAGAILLLFSAVFSLSYVPMVAAIHPLRRRLGDGWVLALPALQVVLEFASMYVFLFPYNHGVSQYRVPYTWQIVSVTGIWGLSYLVFLVNCAIAEVGFRWREGRPMPWGILAGASIPLSLVISFGAWRFEHVERVLREAPSLRVAQLQVSTTMEERMSNPSRVAFEEWLEKTARVAPGSVDLVVWPEGASPYSLQTPRTAKVFAALTRRGGYEMIVGGGARERVPGDGGKTGMVAFNSVYLVNRDGEVTGRYDKMVPLPFGEYMPLAKTPLGFLVNWIEGVGDFRAGESAVVLEGDSARYATPICYEAILGRTCHLFERPDVFVTVTNDAWFGDTAAPHQHAMLAAVRATELGVPMYRGAYTGVSFAVEPHGVIHSETVPYTDVDRIVTVRVEQFDTFYARFGDWFVAACAVGLLAAMGYAPWRK